MTRRTLFALALLTFAGSASGQWTVETGQRDPMTDERATFAESGIVVERDGDNTLLAVIKVLCHPETDRPVFLIQMEGATTYGDFVPFLDGGSTHDIRLRWDRDAPIRMTLIEENSTARNRTILTPINYDGDLRIIRQLRARNRLLVEVPIMRMGSTVLEFDLAGAASAIRRGLASCIQG